MNVSIIANTEGKSGLTEETRPVEIVKLGIGFSNQEYFPEDPFKGELRAYFVSHGYSVNTWNTAGFGLICNDKLWIKEFKAGMKLLGFSNYALSGIKYTDVRTQGEDYVSFVADSKFWSAWCKIQKATNV